MYSVSWLTYHLNVFYAYVQYYTTYLTGMFRDYPLEIKIAAITTTLAFLSIIVIAFILLHKRSIVKKRRKTEKIMSALYSNHIAYLLSEHASPTMTRHEIIQLLGVEKEVSEKKKLLKSKNEKWTFSWLVYRTRISDKACKGRRHNLHVLLEIFDIPEFLENEVSLGTMVHKVVALNMIRTFKLYISPWVINTLLNSKSTRVHRLAMYSSVMASSDSDLDYFETDFFDDNCCIYDEIELGYVLQRRRSGGFKLPNLANWALQRKNPDTQCMFVRLMRRFDQQEYCGQLVRLFHSCNHKKLIEEISRTWGYLHYVEAEQMLTEALLMQPDDTKVAIMHALTRIGSGKSLDALHDGYTNTTNPHVRFEALRCMYNYGEEGRRMFDELEQRATEKDRKFFTFFHNPITLDKIPLDKEQAYHPSVETVYNWSN